MKQLVISILTVLSFSFCYAQLEKGSRLVEGTFGVFGSSRTDEFSLFGAGLNEFEARNNSVFVAPRIGWFTGNNSLIGIGVAYQSNTNKNFNFLNGVETNAFISNDDVFSLNPYFTKFSALTDKLYLTTTVNLAVGLGIDRVENNDQIIEGDIFQLNFDLSPALIYFISDKWAVQGSIGQLFYRFRQTKLKSEIGQQGDPKNVSHDYGLNFSANTYRIGFQYFLTKKGE